MNTLSRRALLGAAAVLPLVACSPSAEATATQAIEQRFAHSPFRAKSDADWRQQLQPASYNVLRHEGTERPGSSPLLSEHRSGTFVCMGCSLPLFRSQWKFESGTGWPSFFDVIHENVGTKIDDQLIEQRT